MIQPPRGFKDILPPQSYILAEIEKRARDIFSIFNYSEIRLPTLEYYELFVKSTGQTTDIVEKEMYKFEDVSGRLLSLRPEGTPGVIRAYINNSMHLSGKKTKFFYIGNMFRAERPQAARYREFEQIGVEYIGDSTPYSDAELILMLDMLIKSTNVFDYRIEINSIGCDKCRKKYKEKLISHLSSKELCDDCKRRLYRNTLRVLDCKVDRDKFSDIPRIELCDECLQHHSTLKRILDANGINYFENHLLVRGLDYYTKTVFEFKTELLGSQDAIAAGGRYDNLVKSMNGPDVAGAGWALGAERLCMLIEKKGLTLTDKKTKVFIVSQKGFEDKAFEILSILRKNSIISDLAAPLKSMKAQLRSADSNSADYVIIIGEEEVKNNIYSIKNLQNGIQEKKSLDEIINLLKKNGG